VKQKPPLIGQLGNAELDPSEPDIIIEIERPGIGHIAELARPMQATIEPTTDGTHRHVEQIPHKRKD